MAKGVHINQLSGAAHNEHLSIRCTAQIGNHLLIVSQVLSLQVPHDGFQLALHLGNLRFNIFRSIRTIWNSHIKPTESRNQHHHMPHRRAAIPTPRRGRLSFPVLNLYPTPQTVSMALRYGPRCSRRDLIWVSTVRVSQSSRIPRSGQQLISGKNNPLMFCQLQQQVKFFGRQINRFSVDPHRSGIRFDSKPPKDQLTAFGLPVRLSTAPTRAISSLGLMGFGT